MSCLQLLPLKSIFQSCKLSRGLNSQWKVSLGNSVSHINPAEHLLCFQIPNKPLIGSDGSSQLEQLSWQVNMDIANVAGGKFMAVCAWWVTLDVPGVQPLWTHQIPAFIRLWWIPLQLLLPKAESWLPMTVGRFNRISYTEMCKDYTKCMEKNYTKFSSIFNLSMNF